MKTYLDLLENNKRWVAEKRKQDPDFFERLASGQHPEILWIGCSDSRVPANEITGTQPGDIFVHRNIANMVIHTDMNLLSVLDYAVNILKIKHIIVCGHYGCGGVQAAMTNKQFGLVDNWLRHIKDTYRVNSEELDSIADEQSRLNRFIELNIIEQVYALAKISIIQNAWARGEYPMLHGWVYELRSGLINDLGVTLDSRSVLPSIYKVTAPLTETNV